MKNLLYIFCAAIICVSAVNTAGAQVKNDKRAAKTAAIAALVDSRNFLFDATYVSPQRGGGHALGSPYDVTVTPDTISAYLPYFGEAHLADYGSTDGGIKVKWTKFDYKVTVNKKGNKEILITPKNISAGDPKAVQSFRFFISSDGYATLQIINLNRDPISFNGTIEPRNPKVQASL